MIAAAMREGIARAGDSTKIISSTSYRGPESDIAVFYGFDLNLRRVFNEYRAAGKTVVYVDLGYWGRRDGGALTGYHKIVVNARHPTAYFQNRNRDPVRAQRFGLKFEDWQRGRYILVAGMSAKSAEVEGYRPAEWERTAINTIRHLTDRPIIYRPKPSWKDAKPIPGADFQPGINDLQDLLLDCHAVVTHHSNVAIDGLLAGIPAYCVAGAATRLAHTDIQMIETPRFPSDREAFVNDLAYTQYTPAEMRAGVAWRYLKDEGLVP
ncbi:MAG: hypothetical protein ACYCZ0_00080 [Minisyncoccota bacterium]